MYDSLIVHSFDKEGIGTLLVDSRESSLSKVCPLSQSMTNKVWPRFGILRHTFLFMPSDLHGHGVNVRVRLNMNEIDVSLWIIYLYSH